MLQIVINKINENMLLFIAYIIYLKEQVACAKPDSVAKAYNFHQFWELINTKNEINFYKIYYDFILANIKSK